MADQRRSQRAGAAAVELAVMLPFLVFLFVITVNFGHRRRASPAARSKAMA
ncbi:MAG TPA: TadE/TadG family type IV pilus assembly protein [Pirellulales bacterium]|nr:TadE/TadG family type IV pilus assembly protein [Pirellulales bacterium]